MNGVFAPRASKPSRSPDAVSDAPCPKSGVALSGLPRRSALVLVLILGLSGTARAWGADGHRIIGELAWRRLSSAARLALEPLLAAPWQTLAEASVWADAVGRSEARFAWARPLHYINADPALEKVQFSPERGSAEVNPGRGALLPRPQREFEEVPCEPKGDTRCPSTPVCPPRVGSEGPARACVVTAVGPFAARVGDPSLSPQDRVLALRWLSHFAGDLHQPLHVAHVDMRGGNTIDVTLPDGYPDSLHAYWDTRLIRERAAGRSWMELVAALELALPGIRCDVSVPESLDEPSLTALALRWADDVLAVARRPELFGLRDFATLPPDYVSRAAPVVDALLSCAGLRLAALLDALVAGSSPAPARLPATEP